MLKKARNSNVEILRIVSMFLIIAFHIPLDEVAYSPIVLLTKSFFGGWGLLGVYIFVCISSWYMIGKRFRSRRIVSLLVQTSSYILGYYAVYLIVKIIKNESMPDILSFSRDFFSGIIGGLFNYTYYWFVFPYILLCMLSPFLNYMIDGLSKRQLEKILIFGAVLLFWAHFDHGLIGDTYGFVYVYLLVGYLKIYGTKIVEKITWSKTLLLFLILVIFFAVSLYIGDTSNAVLSIIMKILNNTVACNSRSSVVLILCAMLIFFSTIKAEEKNNSKINYLASLMFGVYLFHCNDFISPRFVNIFFHYLCHKGLINSSFWFLPSFVLSTVAVLIMGIIVEAIRNTIIQKPIMKVLDKKLENFYLKVDNFFQF